MKNKGFTLIELLAVIVILAIIALIATPIIINIIDNTRKESVDRSIEMYAKSIQNAAANYQLNNPTETVNGVFTSSEDGRTLIGNIELELKYDGESIVCETVEIYKDGNIYLKGCGINTTGEYTYGTEQNEENTGESGTLYTGEIYRNSTEILGIGGNITSAWCIVVPGEYNSCQDEGAYLSSKTECEIHLEELANEEGLDEETQNLLANSTCQEEPISLTYETNVANISQNYYLKHEVVNNIVTASYACITYTENGIRKDVCVRGGDPTYYGSNQAILRSVEPYFNTSEYEVTINGKGYCSFYDGGSYCLSDSFNLDADSDGYVYADDGSTRCLINFDGDSGCYEL